MSEIKFSPNLFLGKQELDRFKRFIDDDGFRKMFLQDATSYGLFRPNKSGAFPNFKVSQGTNAGTIQHNEGIAIDTNGELIRRNAIDNIAVTDDNQWYWVKIKHQKSPIEDGTVSIDANGNLTGVGTLFTEIFRGANNNSVKIRFDNAVSNTGEYEVQEVVDDTNAILNGVFSVESDLNLVVIGAFAPDTTPTAGEKDVFQYDSTEFTLVLETVLETEPTLITDEEFFIARVRNNGGSITVNDVRSRFVYRGKADYEFTFLDTTANPLIGVDSIKFDHPFTTRDRNIAYVSWGFRTTNWAFNASTNRVSVSGGEGGVFKSSDDFTSGDFDGWRLYTEDGSYETIITSTKAGSAFDLDFDTLDFSKLANASQQLLIVPDVEEIELRFESDNTDDQEIVEVRETFPINKPYAKVPLVVYSFAASFKLKYTYRNNKYYSIERLIPSDPVGFYTETSFNDDGNLKDVGSRVRSPYVSTDASGFLSLNISEDAYKNVIDRVVSNDVLGLNVRQLNNLAPLIELFAGTDEAIQWIDHRTLTLNATVDHFINVRREDAFGNTIVQDGSTFTLRFLGDINLGGNQLRIVEGYVNPGDIGTVLYEVTQNDLDILESSGFPLQIEIKYSLELDAFEAYIFGRPIGIASGDLSGNYPSPTVATVGGVSAANMPSDDEKAAMAGTDGTPAAGNTFVTNSDSRNTDSRAPNGSAGGDLDGTYPNPTIALNAVVEDRIANDAVTYNKMQNVAANNVLLGNNSGAGSVVDELTAAEVRTIINVENGATADQSDAEIKTAYENNANTNAFTDADESKLDGIAAGATVNSTDATLLNRANHTGTQAASTISDFDTEVSNNASVVANTAKNSYPSADSIKLAGIATGATANSTDATLLARANHTGTQTAATISNFDTEVSNNASVVANTAKVSNATHTGDVTGSSALTIANSAVTLAKLDRAYVENGGNTGSDTRILTKIIEIGDWNMDTTATVSVLHGVTGADIRSVSAVVRTDTGSVYALNTMGAGEEMAGGINFFSFNGGSIQLRRETGGVFDSTSFDSTSYNRGWITIIYEA